MTLGSMPQDGQVALVASIAIGAFLPTSVGDDAEGDIVRHARAAGQRTGHDLIYVMVR